MSKRCRVCGRLYDGYRCPCRKTQRTARPRCLRCSGGRKWRLAQARARILGGWDSEDLPEADAEAAAEGATDRTVVSRPMEQATESPQGEGDAGTPVAASPCAEVAGE